MSFVPGTFPLQYYRDEHGKGVAWQEIHGIRDEIAKAKVKKRLKAIQDSGQIIGEHKIIHDYGHSRVHELPFKGHGVGPRVYFMITPNHVLLVLAAGDKHSQDKDAERAKQRAICALQRAEFQVAAEAVCPHARAHACKPVRQNPAHACHGTKQRYAVVTPP